jgi:hypothetical protein
LTVGELAVYLTLDRDAYRRGLAQSKQDLKGFQRDAERSAAELRRRYEAEGAAAGKGFAAKLNQGLKGAGKTVKVPVEPDTAGFKEKTEAATRTRPAKVLVEPDLTRFGPETRAYLERLSLEERVKVVSALDNASLRRVVDEAKAKVKADEPKAKVHFEYDRDALSKARSDIGGFSGFLSRAFSLIKIPAIAAGVNAGTVALGAAAAGAISLTSALLPLTGVLAALPGLMAPLGQGLGVVKLATFGVGDAFKALTTSQQQAGSSASSGASAQRAAAKAIESAQRGVRDASEGVADASRNLKQATQGVTDAQKDAKAAQVELNDARKEARERLQDLRLAEAGLHLDERGAALDLKEALADLAKTQADPTATELEKQRAKLRVDQAKQTEKEVAARLRDNAEETAKGVEGSDLVVSAKQRLVQAQKQVTDAQRQAADAARGVAKANERLADAQKDLAEAHLRTAEAADKATSAQSRLAYAMAQLSPAGRRFVRFLANDLKPRFLELSHIAQTGLFPGLQHGISMLVSTYLPLARRGVGQTASALGDLAERGARMVTSGPWRRDFAAMVANNTRLLTVYGGAGLHVADALRNVIMAAEPLVNWIARLAAGWAKTIDKESVAARQSGQLADFFDRTRQVLGLLLGTLGHFAHALIPVFAGGTTMGMDFLKIIERGATDFDHWTHSAQGAASIGKLFSEARPVLAAIGRLILAVGKNLRGMTGGLTGGGLAKLLDQISTSAVPALMSLAKTASGQFITNLVSLATGISRILGSVAGGSGTLTSFVGVLGVLANVTATLLDHVPGLDHLVVAITTLAAIGKATGLTSLIAAFPQMRVNAALLESQGKKTNLQLAWMIALKVRDGAVTAANWAREAAVYLARKVALAAQVVGMLAVRGATLAWTAAQWLLNAAMLANPIGLWIAGIAAAIAVIVLIATKTTWFQTIWRVAWGAIKGAAKATWDWIKGNWPLLLAILTGPIGLAVVAIVRNWDRIKGAGKAAFDAVGAAGRFMWDGVLRPIFAALVNGFLTVAGAIVRGAATAFGWVPGLGGRLKDAAKTFDTFRDDVNRKLGGIKDKSVDVTAKTKVDPNVLKVFTAAGGRVRMMATGGLLPGFGGGDRIPVLAEPGEAVVDKHRTRAYAPLLAAMGVPGFAGGGLITRDRGRFGRDVVPGYAGMRNRASGLMVGSAKHALDLLAPFLGGVGGGFSGGAASGNVIALAMAQARRMGSSHKVALALIEAGIVESGLRNLNYGDRDSLGFLQQRPSQGWAHPMDISYAAYDFLRRAIPIQGHYSTAGQLAQAVQRSAFPARYDQHQSQAEGIIRRYGFDQGGVLRPGWNVVYNNLGYDERLVRARTDAQWHAATRGGDGASAAGGIHVENLNVRAYSDKFSLKQVAEDLAYAGVH